MTRHEFIQEATASFKASDVTTYDDDLPKITPFAKLLFFRVSLRRRYPNQQIYLNDKQASRFIGGTQKDLIATQAELRGLGLIATVQTGIGCSYTILTAHGLDKRLMLSIRQEFALQTL